MEANYKTAPTIPVPASYTLC